MYFIELIDDLYHVGLWLKKLSILVHTSPSGSSSGCLTIPIGHILLGPFLLSIASLPGPSL